MGSPFGNYTLNLGADLRLASSEGKPGPRFSIKTTLTTPRDEFVVLGSAPNGWEPGESVIMAVRIPSSDKE
ncbi:MAG: hypothetical protein IPK83_08145 [Planctomycetes bacterium]|nr:hypothetical protein [Planctomycetota bacterium]